MKITGTCKRDGREFLLDQAIASGGACPWDGEPFNPAYAVVLVDAMRDAVEAGSRLETALQRVADLTPDLTLDEASIVGPLRAQLDRLSRNVVRRG